MPLSASTQRRRARAAKLRWFSARCAGLRCPSSRSSPPELLPTFALCRLPRNPSHRQKWTRATRKHFRSQDGTRRATCCATGDKCAAERSGSAWERRREHSALCLSPRATPVRPIHPAARSSVRILRHGVAAGARPALPVCAWIQRVSSKGQRPACRGRSSRGGAGTCCARCALRSLPCEAARSTPRSA